jgi:hypothetical protein
MNKDQCMCGAYWCTTDHNEEHAYWRGDNQE